MTDEPIDLEKERRIRRKVRGLGEAIEAAGDRSEFTDNPTAYLESKATMTDRKQAYTVADVAELLDVTTDTVRRWCRDGDLEAAKLGSAGYRISRPALDEFWRDRGGGTLFIDPGGVTVGIQGDDLPRDYLAVLESDCDTTTTEQRTNPVTGRSETYTHGWIEGTYGPQTSHVGTVVRDTETDRITSVYGIEAWAAPLVEEYGEGDG